MYRRLQCFLAAVRLALAIALLSVSGAAFAQSTLNFTALWWNAAESGWGINVNHQGDTLFATLFTYDGSGAPMWLVMSGGARQAGTDTFTGDLYRTTGPAFNAVPFTPINAANVTRVGSMTLAFAGSNAATLSYSVDGASVSKSVSRQVFGSAAAECQGTSASRSAATNYQDLWWNANESGWGLNVTHQDNTLFATLFTYDASGRGLWLVMSAGARQADGSYQGALYRTSGPRFNASPWTGATATEVGTMRLRFTDGVQGTLDYTVNGIAVSKQIRRQEFSTSRPLCAMASAPPPPAGSSDCTTYVRGRVLTFDVLGNNGNVMRSYTRSFGPDTTFNGHAVQQVIDETSASERTIQYIQDLATVQVSLGQRQTGPNLDSTLRFEPPSSWPKQWAVGQAYNYVGQYIPSGTGPQQPTSYSVTGSMVRRETVVVPAGSFEACYFRLNFTSLGATVLNEQWIAPGVGTVKLVGTFGTTSQTIQLRQLQ